MIDPESVWELQQEIDANEHPEGDEPTAEECAYCGLERCKCDEMYDAMRDQEMEDRYA